MRNIAVTIVVCLTCISSAHAQSKGIPAREHELPGPGEVDRWDYDVLFAFPAQTGFRLMEYSLDGELLHWWDHENLEDAQDQRDFLETRMMLLYEIEEFELSQIWFDYGRYDTYGEAYEVAAWIESLGFDTDIRQRTAWGNFGKR